MNKRTSGASTALKLGLLFILALLVRLPFRARFTVDPDAANYTLGVLFFDVHQHAPHPPGYLFYVLLARPIAALIGDPHAALTILSCVLTAASVFPVFLLGRRWGGPRVGWWAALMTCFNPVTWYHGSVALSGTTEVVLAPLVILFLARGLDGRPRDLVAGSLALGLAGGFRQSMMLFLIPAWLWSLWRTRTNARTRGLAVLAAGVGLAAWIVPTVINAGGLGPYLAATNYVRSFVDAHSFLFGATFERVAANQLRWLAAVTSGLGLAGVTGLAALVVGSDVRRRLLADRDLSVLLLLWITPAVAFLALISIAKPAYVLSFLPALWLVACAALLVLGDAGRARRVAVYVLLLGSLLASNVQYFATPAADRLAWTAGGYQLQHTELPAGEAVARQWRIMTRDTIRIQDQRVETTNTMIRDARARHGDIALVVPRPNLYAHRMAMLYWPDMPIYALSPDKGSGVGVIVARDMRQEGTRAPAPRTVAVDPAISRLLWITSMHRDLDLVLLEKGGEPVGSGPLARGVLTEPGPASAAWGVTFAR